ncbi:MAG TPA: DUF1570 domain-containing protein [Isosphaeraceae bacterium]|jgi:hypothetical protein|nr:DUF1570 domain-containing protein [Isosphaeraceae bacterium]
MHTGDDHEPRSETSWTRRTWLGAAVAGALGGWCRADEPAPAPPKDKAKARLAQRPKDPDEQKEIEGVNAQAKKAGLEGFQTSRSTHFLAIGDAPDAFREKALKICEKLAVEYQHHFQFKGFKLSSLPHTLTVVTLADADSFKKFSGLEADPGVGGYYEQKTNRLVILDNRDGNQANLTQAQQANLVSLVHEASHQLTYNTGLLNREGDVPVCISEGLANYAEAWSPTRLSHLGGENIGRRQGLDLAKSQRLPWIPISKLLTDDALFQGGGGDDPALQLAYGESWLLVYQLMSKPSRIASFRDYLKAIFDRRDDKERLADAQAHLQDLDQLDKDLRIAARFPAR